MERKWKLLVSMLFAALVCVCLSPIGAYRAQAFSGTSITVSGYTYGGSVGRINIGGGYVQVDDKGSDKAVITISGAEIADGTAEDGSQVALDIISSKNVEILIDGETNVSGTMRIQTLNQNDRCDYSKKVTISAKSSVENADKLFVSGQLRGVTGELWLKSGFYSVSGDKGFLRKNYAAVYCEGALTLGELSSGGTATGPSLHTSAILNVGVYCKTFKMSGGHAQLEGDKVGLAVSGEETGSKTSFLVEGGTLSMEGGAASCLIAKYTNNSGQAVELKNRMGGAADGGGTCYVIASGNYGSRTNTFMVYSFSNDANRKLELSTSDFYASSLTSNALTSVICKRSISRVKFQVSGGLSLPIEYWDYEPGCFYGLLPTPTAGENNVEATGWEDKANNKTMKESSAVPSKDVNAKASYKDITPKSFKDVPGSAWFAKAANYCAARGLITGTGDGTTFAPTTTITRGMIVTILYRLEGSPDVSGSDNPFPDVPKSAWFHDAVLWAKDCGVVTGYNDGTYGPGKNATREQVALILKRYAEYRGLYNPQDAASVSAFPDAKSVSSWAKDAVSWAYGKGIISGKETPGQAAKLQPQGSAVRAEFATMLMRYITKTETSMTFYLGEELNMTVPGNWYNNVDVHMGEDQYSKFLEFRSKAFAKQGLGGRVFKIRLMTEAEYLAQDHKYEYIGVLLGSKTEYYVAAQYCDSDKELNAPFESDLWCIYNEMLMSLRNFTYGSQKYKFTVGKG